MKQLYFILGVAVAVKGASIPVTEVPGTWVTLGVTGFTWKYDSQTVPTVNDPANWDGVCSSGTMQSPIDVEVSKLESPKDDVGKVVNHLYELDISGDLYNTDRHLTYQIKEDLKPYISGGPLDSKYVFDHMDFHFGSDDTMGSEHTIDGAQSPGEIYLVFYDGDAFSSFADASASTVADALATVSYMVSTDSSTADNAGLAPIIDEITAATGVEDEPGMGLIYKNIDINLEKIFGLSVDDYYYYDGSLTTPGCSENVKWILSTKKIALSTAQMTTLRTLETEADAGTGFTDTLADNFRPVQALGTRKVTWRRAKLEIDPSKAQILGATIIGAGVFHNVYNFLQQPETAKALRENALVDFINNIPTALLGEPEVQQRSSEEQQFVQQYAQPVYQPQQYQQYVPQVPPAAAPAPA